MENGEEDVCNILISCVGLLDFPTIPPFKGLDQFKGELFPFFCLFGKVYAGVRGRVSRAGER